MLWGPPARLPLLCLSRLLVPLLPFLCCRKAGVADPQAFKDRPEILMYGMLCVMIAAAFWDIFRCGTG